MSKLVDSNGRAADAEVQLVSPTGAPVSAEPPKLPEQLQLTPDAQGYVYKFSDNPHRKGTYVMHTIDGVIVAVVPDPRVANLLCEAVRMLCLANASIQPKTGGVTEGSEVPDFAKEKAA